MKQFQTYNSLNDLPKIERIVVLGHFDGVHKGHQELLKKGRSLADEYGIPLTVFTFFPQFQSLMKEDFKYVIDNKEKLNLLAGFGVNEVVTIPFSYQIAKLSPEKFVKDILLDCLIPREIIVGFNYKFGYKAIGDSSILIKLVAPRKVHVIKPYKYKNQIISSSVIRKEISKGNIDYVNKLLGYPYKISGKVISGKKNGRKFFVPTANLTLNDRLVIPKNGVYIGNCTIIGRDAILNCVINIGTRPTVDSNELVTIEAHILDFDENIYGENIEVFNLVFIREIRRFSSYEDLKDMINNDVKKARELLSC